MGGKDLEPALAQLSRTQRKAVARRVLKRAGQIFADRANALAPRGGGTPHLAGSYGVATTVNKRNRKEAILQYPTPPFFP